MSDTIQQRVIKYIDDNEDNNDFMGKELNALIALQARKCIASRKKNQFIAELAEALNVEDVIGVAYWILDYMYPRNGNYAVYDKMYYKIVKDSAWFKYVN